ncbi:MAG TPA: hypothetical protein VHL08_09405 [Dongiaceae bacterium]|nr:hypothetical protein [Dongiaceae bacterium]
MDDKDDILRKWANSRLDRKSTVRLLKYIRDELMEEHRPRLVMLIQFAIAAIEQDLHGDGDRESSPYPRLH